MAWIYGDWAWLAAASIVVGCASFSAAGEAGGQKFRVYFGTYTDKGSKGIYYGEFDAGSGQLKLLGVAAETQRPSFLAIHPNRKFLYAVGELASFEGKKTGAVNAFAIRPDGTLELLNQKSSGNVGPCHVVVDATGQCAIVSNYSGGSVASLPIEPDGKLRDAATSIQHEGKGANPKRQDKAHAHSATIDPSNRFAYVCDLGLDKIMIYKLDPAAGTLKPNDPAFATTSPGAGPRHFAFHPNGRFAYVINELNNTVTAFRLDAQRGGLETIESVPTLPADFSGNNTTADIHIHPSGKFLYGSNRGHDSIAMFAIDPTTGKLTALGNELTQGKTPRNFAIDPTGRWLLAAHQDSSNVVVFKIDEATGKLTPTGQSVEVPNSVCIRF